MLWLVQIATLSTSQSSDISINLTSPYFWMSLSLNIAMTLAIVSRLLYFRWRVYRVLGPRHGSQYTSVAAIIVESALLYSAATILFLIPFALNNGLQNSFLQLLSQVQIIAPLLITYRIAHGNAWVADTLATKDHNNSGGGPVKVELNVHRDKLSTGIIFAKSELSHSATTDYEMGQV